MSDPRRPIVRCRAGHLGVLGAMLALLIAPATSGADPPWRYKDLKASICADGKARWGKPRGWSCSLLSTTVSAKVAYNGRAVWGQWIDCQGESVGVGNKVTWCQYWNNGGRAPHRFMSLGANGEIDGSIGPFRNFQTYWIRIDVHPDGKTRLRGGTNRD